MGIRAVHVAANPEILDMLIQKGASLKVKDNHGNLPVHIAAAADRPEVVQDLVKRGMDINAVNDEGMTPLLMAAQKAPGCKTIDALLKNGADINSRDLSGKTALVIAQMAKNQEAVDFLKKSGCKE
jgi:ankyrin repeat protein